MYHSTIITHQVTTLMLIKPRYFGLLIHWSGMIWLTSPMFYLSPLFSGVNNWVRSQQQYLGTWIKIIRYMNKNNQFRWKVSFFFASCNFFLCHRDSFVFDKRYSEKRRLVHFSKYSTDKKKGTFVFSEHSKNPGSVHFSSLSKNAFTMRIFDEEKEVESQIKY